METAPAETGAKGRTNAGSFKPGGPPGPGRGKKTLVSSTESELDLFNHMQWVLDHAKETSEIPIRRAYKKLLDSDLGKFTDRYTALLKARNAALGAGKRDEEETGPDAGEEKVEALIEQLLAEWEAEEAAQEAAQTKG
jgi:hypothetical protein